MLDRTNRTSATRPGAQSSGSTRSLVVFAAGKGTRLLPLTRRVPKAMVPALDIPLVDLALGRSGAGWESRFVNLSGPSSLLRDHLETSHPGVELFDEGDEGIGTAATLRCLEPRLAGTVVTYNCDLVSDLSIDALRARHAVAGNPCTLAVKRVDEHADLEVAGGRLMLIDRRVHSRPGYLFLGAACFDRNLLASIPPTKPLGLVEGLLRPALVEGLVGLVEHRGYGRDAGTLRSYLEVSQDALRGQPGGIQPPGTQSAQGWYLGPGATAEPESLDEGAVVLAGARVKRGAKVGRAIVWPGSVVPSGARVYDGIWFEDRFLPTRAS